MTSNNTEPALVYLVDERDEILDRTDPDCGCLHTEDCPEINRTPGWEDAIRTGATWSGITAAIALIYLGLDRIADNGEYLLTPYLTVPTIAAIGAAVGLTVTLVTRFRRPARR